MRKIRIYLSHCGTKALTHLSAIYQPLAMCSYLRTHSALDRCPCHVTTCGRWRHHTRLIRLIALQFTATLW